MTLVIFLGPGQRLAIKEDPQPPARLAATLNAGRLTLADLGFQTPREATDADAAIIYLARQIGDFVVVSDPASLQERVNRKTLPAVRLTSRERQVLRYLINGASTRQIARELAINPRTVRAYTHQLKERLNAQNLAQLIGRAVMMGII